MEQAKKRDHKIYITDTAVAKVPFVQVPQLSGAVCRTLQQEHRHILQIAQKENNSNEVLSILSISRDELIHILGSEFQVQPGNNPAAFALFETAMPKELYYLHNHPSTNIFSLPDIFAFLKYACIGLISVVTNQGEVYILHKNDRYSYTETRSLFVQIMQRYEAKEITHQQAVKLFLKSCVKGGIDYAKSK